MPPDTPPETIAQIAGFAIAAILLAALIGTRWGARRERGRQERNEALSILRIMREENTRNFDEMRDRLRHIESRLDANAAPSTPASDTAGALRAPAPPAPE